MCIFRKITLPPPTSELTFDVGHKFFDRGLGLAVQRRFVRLLGEARDASALFRGSEDTFINLLHRHEAAPESAVTLPAAHLTSTALEQLASHALSGSPIGQFLKTVKDLRDLLLAAGDAAFLLKTDVLGAIGRRVAETSVWTELADQIERDGVWRRYAMLSSRGRGVSALDARSSTELWESQLTALRAGCCPMKTTGLPSVCRRALAKPASPNWLYWTRSPIDDDDKSSTLRRSTPWQMKLKGLCRRSFRT